MIGAALRQGELVEIGVAGRVRERVGVGVDGALDHAQRHGRHRACAGGERHRRLQRAVGDFVGEAPCLRPRGVKRFGQHQQALRPGWPHQVDDARNRAPAHVHASFDFRRVDRRIAAKHPQVGRRRQRDAAADAPAFDRRNRERLHRLPSCAHAPADLHDLPPFSQRRVAESGGFRVAQIEAHRKDVGAAGQDNRRSFCVAFKTAGCRSQLAHQAKRQCVCPVSAVEPHHGDIALSLNRHEAHPVIPP